MIVIACYEIMAYFHCLEPCGQLIIRAHLKRLIVSVAKWMQLIVKDVVRKLHTGDRDGSLERLQTPVQQAFSYGIRHIIIVIQRTVTHSSVNHNMPYPV